MNMKPGLQLKAAIIPLVLAGALSGIISGCKKNNNSSGSSSSGGSSVSATIGNAVDPYFNFGTSNLTAVDDTAAHEIQVTGITVTGGDSTTLSIYFPDSVTGPSYLLFDGIQTFMNYKNQAAAQNYFQTPGNASGSLTITYFNATTHEVRANFTGNTYRNGNSSDSLLNVYNGALIATYTAP